MASDEARSPALWVEFTDGDGEDGAARWGSDNVTDEKLEKILAFAVDLLGQPDTTV